MSKTILVTGGAGYIGTAVVDVLLKSGHQVVVFDDLSAGQREKVPAGAEFTEGDVTDRAALAECLAKHTFDAVIHCAAKKAVGESEQDPAGYFHNNVGGTLALLTEMANAGVPHLVFSSTAAVYDPKEPAPFTEETPLAPASVYGESKYLAERLIQSFVRTGKLSRYTILRYFNVAGDVGLQFLETKAENVFPVIGRALQAEQPFHIFGTDYETKDGTGVRDYIHLADLAHAHEVALADTTSEIYNLGTSTGHSVRELIAAFEAASGRTIAVEESPRRPGDVGLVTADATKAHERLAWQPTKSLVDMVASTWELYQDQQSY
jgi:UDP-glucose 4-epimerase